LARSLSAVAHKVFLMSSSMGWQAQSVDPAIDYASGSLTGPVPGGNRCAMSAANAAGLHVASVRRAPVSDLPAGFTDLDRRDSQWVGWGNW